MMTKNEFVKMYIYDIKILTSAKKVRYHNNQIIAKYEDGSERVIIEDTQQDFKNYKKDMKKYNKK